jgi:Xaa-Pro aminopeptidase
MLSRINRLRAALRGHKLDGFLVTSPVNLRYLCGYTGSNGLLLVTKRAAYFYTDFRYKEQIRTEVKGCRKRVLERNLWSVTWARDARGVRRLGLESGHVTLAQHRSLRKNLKGPRLVPTDDLTMSLRRAKESSEVGAIARAQSIADRVLARVLPTLKPGVRERDIALEIDFQFRRMSEGNSFESIVASGPNAAKPHAGYSDRRLRKGDCLTLDIGCRVSGYCSDLTRTVFIGRASAELRRVYEIVRKAQELGLELIRPGEKASDVDAAARDYITAQGYGKAFGHSLGHGVGLEVHERPTLAKLSKDVLTPGDIVTVEPGIYLPGKGGVRIEDLVLVTPSGCRNLTRSPKQLLEL